MNATECQRAASLLTENGKDIRSQEYREQSFGSWQVVASTQPARRLVWDGKEGWYVVEEETAGRFNGLPVWRELWIDRNPRPESLELAVKAVLSGETTPERRSGGKA